MMSQRKLQHRPRLNPGEQLFLNTKLDAGTHKQAAPEDGCSKGLAEYLRGKTVFG